MYQTFLFGLCSGLVAFVTALPQAEVVPSPSPSPAPSPAPEQFDFPIGVDTVAAPAPPLPTELADDASVAQAYNALYNTSKPGDIQQTLLGEDRANNCWGSWYCGHAAVFSAKASTASCKSAYERYSTAAKYSRFQARTSGHCAAYFDCTIPVSYSGSFIKERFDEIYSRVGCKICGKSSFPKDTSAFYNNCNVRLDYCSDCVDFGSPDNNGLDDGLGNATDSSDPDANGSPQIVSLQFPGGSDDGSPVDRRDTY